MLIYLSRHFSYAVGILFIVSGVFPAQLGATGIQDVAPTAADAPVMLEAGRPGFGIFAEFNGPEDGRLVVSIGDASEVLYIGLSPEYRDNGSPFSSDNFSRYRFQIRQITSDGTNPIVHGPFTIDNGNANVNSYEDAAFGVYDLSATQFGDSIYVFRPDAAGEYSIEFDEFTNDGSARVTIPFWDFTVIKNGAPVEGRLWSRGWAFRTPQVDGTVQPDCVWDRQFNGDLYSYTEDGFVSRINFANSGFQGLSFNMAFNERGPGQSGDIAADRQSVPGTNATDDAAQHRIFLELPDINLFPDGVCGEIQAAQTFTCDGAAPYCLDVAVTRPGQVNIILDFNGNGFLDENSEDVALVYDFAPGDLATCVPWDGLRGDSTIADFTDTVDIIITYSQGIQHWSAFDVEFMKNGFCVETIRPICPGNISSDILYWDDRNISEDPGTGAPKDNRSGNACLEVPRTWDFFQLNSDQCDDFDDALTAGYGDKNTLNTWWFANSRTQFRARVPVISAMITGRTELCSGDVSTLVAADPNATGELTFLWSGPGVDGITTDSVDVDASGEYCVTISDELGCSNQTCVTVTVFEFDSDQFPEGLSICFGDSIQMPVAGDPSFTYVWTPSTGISSTTSNQPTFSPQVTTTFIATISGASTTGEICEITEEITIEVAPEIGLQVFGGGPICDETTTITATTVNPAIVQLFGPDGMLIGTGNEFTVPVSGETDYSLVATNVQGCVDSASFTVSGGPVNISVPDSLLTCLSDGVMLGVTNLDPNDMLSYQWSPANLFTPESVNSANPVFIGEQGDYTVTVVVENQYGCSVEEDVQLIVIDDNGSLSFEPVLDCDGRTVTFNNTSSVTFGYVYDFGDGNTSNETSPTHVYQTAGTFTVTLDLIYDQDCVASFSREVTTFETLVEADFGIDFGNCDNGSATLQFTDQSVNQTGAPLEYAWNFTGVTPTSSDLANPIVSVNSSGTVTASLEVTTVDGCSSVLDTTFTVDLAVVSLQEEIIICPGETTPLNPGGNPDLIYSWSPAPDFDANAVNPVTGTAGTYVVTVTSNNADFNCVNTDTVTVIIPADIGLVVNGPDGPIGDDPFLLSQLQTCGSAIDLSIDLTVNDGVTVTYTDVDGNVLGTGNTFSVNPDSRDTIIITAVNEFGCIESDTVAIINRQVDAGIDVGADGITLCSDVDTTLSVVNFDLGDTLSYQWEPNAIINGPLDGPTVSITSPLDGTINLMVMVTNQFDCDTVITVPVVVVPFTPNEYPDLIQPCFDEPFTIVGGPAIDGYTYVWTPNDNLDLTDPANPVGVFTEDGMLEVVITDESTGCTITRTITVDTAPEISFSVDPEQTDICGTGVVTVTGMSVNDNVVITWYNDAGLTDVAGVGATIDINANVMGQTFTIFGEAVDPTTGCSQVVSASVNSLVFTPNMYPEVVTPCYGEPITIQGGDAVAGYTYEWTPNGDLDLTDPANPVGVFTEDVELVVVITDPVTGCTVNDTVFVDTAPEISFTVDPEETDICGTGTVTITGASVNDNVVITWYNDAGLTDIAGTGATIDVDANIMGQTFTVFGEAVDPTTGCSQVVSASVNTLVFTPNDYPDIVTPCFGESFTIVGGAAVAGYTYEWTPNGDLDLSDPANPVGVFTEDVELVVVITDPITGCTVNDTVFVDTAPEISFSVDPGETNICGTDVITVTGTSVNDNVVITWYNDIDLTDSVGTGATFDINANVMGSMFTVYGEAVDPATGCSQVASATVNTIIFMPNNYPDTLTPCFGEPISIIGGDAVAGYTYEWTPSDDLDLTDPANPVGVFTEEVELIVTITDPVTSCSIMDTVFIDTAPEIAFSVDPPLTNICGTGIVNVDGASPNDDVVITWYNDPELTDVAGTGPRFTIVADVMGQTYTIYGEAVDTITGCSQSLPATVVTTEFTPNQYEDVVMPCYEEAFTLVGGPIIPGYTYTWSPSDQLDLTDPANPVGIFTEDTDLSVTITDPETGCTETQNISVLVHPEISFMASSVDTILCEPGMVTITGSSVNEAVEIVWYDDQELTIELGQGPVYVIDAAEPGEGYVIYGVATDPNTGCQQVVPVKVTVSELTLGLPLEVIDACAGDRPSIFGESGALANLEYTYTPANLVDDSDPLNPVFTGNASAVITVNVFDPETECSAETTVTVNITDLTVLEGFANPTEIFVGDQSELTVTGCVGCEYEWFPQDGTVSPTTGATVIATPTEPGDYIYEVDVTQNGCLETVLIELRVEDPICDTDRIFVPNAFTPNGDNMNDVLQVRSNFAQLLTEFRFIIYNRWGQEVYSSDDINDAWDGTAEGDDLEPDVYGYWLRVRCPSGEELIQRGNVTIQR